MSGSANFPRVVEEQEAPRSWSCHVVDKNCCYLKQPCDNQRDAHPAHHWRAELRWYHCSGVPA